MEPALREYQSDAVERLRAAMSGGARAPLYVLPTGGGKTAVFGEVARRAVERGSRVCVLAHRRELVGQAAGRLSALGLDVGRIQAGVEETPDAPVQCASVQTLARRLDRVAPPDLVVVDEAHHAPAGQWRQVRDAWPSAWCLGVTATPCRLDGRGLEESFDDMVLGPSAAELTRDGWLAPADVYAPSVPDLAGVRRRGGDYAPGDLEKALASSDVVGDAVRSFQSVFPDRGTAVAFCASVAHAKATAEALNAAGVASAMLTGADNKTDREATLARLASGEVRVLATVDVISEGFDLPAVSGAILLRPTKSLGLYLQQVGRALRPAPGKSSAVVLDHAGNALRHGLPEETRDWSLAGGAPTRPAADVDDETGAPLSVRQCLNCYAVHPAAPVCPMCGAEHPKDERIPRARAGELRKLEAEEAERARRAAREAERKEEKNAQTLEELKAIEHARGYKPGWAHKRHAVRQKRLSGGSQGADRLDMFAAAGAAGGAHG